MKNSPKITNRWRSYIETRCDEVLHASDANDVEKMKFLVRHHLGDIIRELEQPDLDINSLREAAGSLLYKRLLPVQLALALLSDPDFPIRDSNATEDA